MKYFTEKELKIENAPKEVKANMNALVKYVLDPLREKTGRIKITSGYRSPEYNKKVGGSPKSQHVYGMAVDLIPLDLEIEGVWKILKEFNVDQAILESKNGVKWIHVSFNSFSTNRKQFLKAYFINNKMHYEID